MGISRDVLYAKLMEMLEDEDYREKDLVARLIRLIVHVNPKRGCYRKGPLSDWDGLPCSKSLFHSQDGCGLAIGNLTSQLFSNVYLASLDNYIQRILKVRTHSGGYDGSGITRRPQFISRIYGTLLVLQVQEEVHIFPPMAFQIRSLPRHVLQDDSAQQGHG